MYGYSTIRAAIKADCKSYLFGAFHAQKRKCPFLEFFSTKLYPALSQISSDGVEALCIPESILETRCVI